MDLGAGDLTSMLPHLVELGLELASNIACHRSGPIQDMLRPARSSKKAPQRCHNIGSALLYEGQLNV